MNKPFVWVGLGAVLLVAVLLAAGFAGLRGDRGAWDPDAPEVEVGDRVGSLLDEIVFTQEVDMGKVIELIEGGAQQVVAQGVSNPGLFRRIRDSERVDHAISYGSSQEITVNPVGPIFADGRLNPFHVREVREALNWLVNRRHVAEEIYGGLAVPRYLPLSTAFPDYARLADVARRLELRYQHDPARAEAIFDREMRRLGAEKVNQVWMYEGRPVRLTVLIRSEDERRRVGDYIGNLMEGLGFQVERLYRTAEEAARIWILGDPAAGRWHLYTGAWGATVISRDQSDNISFYYTRRGRPEPLWQAYDPDPELDELADRLQRRDYTEFAERQAMMARALDLAMEDSVRVWLIDQINVWPHARNVALAVDLAAGVAGSNLWPYTLRYRDRIGGRVVFGTPSLLTQPWNPVDGSNFVFDMMIQRAVADLPVLPDPFTGLWLPQRIESAAVTVREGVPVVKTHDWLTLEKAEEIQVPDDVWIDWDVAEQRFVTVGEKHPEGITARAVARIRYEEDYFDRRWHDGTRFSMADLIAGWILTFERAREESRLYDAAHVPAFEVFQRQYRGWRILSQQPLEIEVYGDQIYPDAEWIAATRATSASPWHSLAIGIRAELNGELAFSSHKADQLQVEWMSYIAGPSLRILERHLRTARAEGFVPFPQVLRDFMRPGEVEERYAALTEWFGQRRHFWINDGPYYLHSVHPVERSVVVRRSEFFTDRADKWLRFTRPEIPVLDLDGPVVVEAGSAVEFELEITFDGRAYEPDQIDMARFLVFDSRGEVAEEGNARHEADGRWVISLSAETVSRLGVGANSLEVAVSSLRVALPTFATHAFATIPARHVATDPAAPISRP
jgi:peptide/nickel transport system substrate-binding protein